MNPEMKQRMERQFQTYIMFLLSHPHATCWTFKNTMGTMLWKAKGHNEFFNHIETVDHYANK